MSEHASPREYLAAGRLGLELVWDDGKIIEIRMSWADPARRPVIATEAGRAMAEAVARYVAGQEPNWPDLPLAWERLPPFQRAALKELAKVPSGQTVSYGELAARLGKPKAARAAGRAMATNPFPIVLPCHRVRGANGALTGFGGGLDMKRWLLELEGAL